MKIVVFMKNWLGDALFQMPAVDAIKAAFPTSEITCIAPERCREILETQKSITNILSFDEKTSHRQWCCRPSVVWELRRLGHYDKGFLFHRSGSRAFWLYCAGVRDRIGYGKGFFLTQKIEMEEDERHQVDFFIEFVKRAGIPVKNNAKYKFFITSDDEKEAARILKENGVDEKFIVFHLGSNREEKRWPPEYFADLAERVWNKYKLPIVATGTLEDLDLWEKFKSKLADAKAVHLMGKTKIRVSAAIYKKSLLVVSGDSGPMHIATGVGTNVAALFGPTSPELFGPRGMGKEIILTPDNNSDKMSDISCGRVFAAVEELLKDK